MNLPRAGTGKKSDATGLSSESEMHGQAVATYETAMILNISQVFQKRRSLRKDIDSQTLLCKPFSELIVIEPVFHRPNRACLGRNGNISRQISFDRFRQNIGLSGKLE